MWDAIVLGSGMGGLGAAAALAHRGLRVLVLDQHTVAGGLTQTFRRRDWTFNTGVHYIGGVGPQPGAQGQFGRLLQWLSNGQLAFNDWVVPTTSSGSPVSSLALNTRSPPTGRLCVPGLRKST